PFSAPTPSATPPPPPPHRPPLPLRDALPISARREPYASPPACRGETLFFARAGGLFGGAGSAGFGGPGFFGGVGGAGLGRVGVRSEEHTSELQSRVEVVCRLLLAEGCVSA